MDGFPIIIVNEGQVVLGLRKERKANANNNKEHKDNGN
jgi:hypothetical protein